jgi:two-component system, NarL family, invasion response regulator UvrY
MGSCTGSIPPEPSPSGCHVTLIAPWQPYFSLWLDGVRMDGVMGLSALIVDDHEGFRREARAVLVSDGIDVIGEAGTGEAAVTEAGRLRPTLVLLDIGLPDASGLDLVGRIRELAPAAAIVLISGRRASEYGGRVAAARADGFIDKAALRPGVIPALLSGLPAR